MPPAPGGFSLNPANLFASSRPGSSQGQPSGQPAPQPSPAVVPGSGGMPNQQPNPAAGKGADGQPLPELNLDGTPKPKPDASPLDAFSDLFTIDPKKEPVKDPLKDPIFNVDPAKLAEVVSKMDFARNLPPELVAKALGGDAASFSTILNAVARNSYLLSTQMMTKLVASAFETNNGRWEGALSSRFRDFQINFSEPQNAALKHKAAQPVLTALKSTIAIQNPELSPMEVSKKAEDYFLSMAKAINSVGTEELGGGGKGTGGKGAPAVEMDWLKYLEPAQTP